ncbi:MAG: hypothetical protein ACU826_03870 [Gammaproteobacteria bacterium]
MKKSFCFLLLVVIGLSGCSTLHSKASPEVLASIRKIAVVPLEPPPLFLGPVILEALGDVPNFGYPLDIIGGIVVLTQLTKYKEERENMLEKQRTWHEKNQVWVPTRALAREAARRIAKAHSYEVSVSQKLQILPGVKNRAATWHMQNWYAPIKRWYDSDAVTLNTDDFRRQGIDAILEIGILNYEISRGYFYLQVMTKLTSVSSGKVVARARYIPGGTPPQVESYKRLFENEAAHFKEVFTTESGRQLGDNLKKMGL